MSATHTPGPWRWMNDDTLVADYSRRAVVITGGRGGTLQTCGANGRLRQFRADDPNARLIAAAPDLLQFVEAFAACPTEGEIPGHWSDKAAMDRMIRTARAIVAKAAGRTPEGV